MQEILQKFGLSQSESKVYLSLIELGASLAGDITKKANINRSNCYDVLQRLIEKGLVSYVIKANRKYFQAETPQKFLELIKEEENQLRNKEKEIKGILPQLIEKSKISAEKPEATIYKGKKGIKTIFEDVLKHQENLVFGSHGRFREVLGPFFEQYQRRKKSLKIHTKLLLSERLRRSDIVKLTPGETKFLKKEYDSPVSTIIYGDKVATIIWTEEPIGFVIKGNEVSNSFKNYFKIMWEIAEK